jgi:fucose 4-O-acetylase-like acetyltransferase
MAFLLIFCAFIVNKPKPDSIRNMAKKKAQRLLVPWLFWCAIYGIMKVIKTVIEGSTLYDNFSISMFLTGPRLHLWFLPYAFIAALCLNYLHNLTEKIPLQTSTLIMSVIGVVALLVSSIILANVELPLPFGHWIFGLPALLLGFAVGQNTLSEKGHSGHNPCFYIIPMIIAVSVTLYGLGYTDRMLLACDLAIGVGAVCAAFHWHGRLDPVSRVWGSLSYGIYFVHPFVITSLRKLGMCGSKSWLDVLMIFLISSLLVFLLKKTPARQFV